MYFIHVLLPLLSMLSVALPLWTGRRVRGFLWYYVLLSALCDSFYYLNLWPPYAYWFGNAFWAAQFGLVTGFFAEAIPFLRARRWRRAIAGGVGVVVILFCIHACEEDFRVLDFHGGAALYGLLLLPVMAGFYSLVQGPLVARLERSPLFLVCVAFLLYSAGSFLLLLFMPRFRQTDHSFVRTLWVVLHDGLNILKNLLIARALYLSGGDKSSVRSASYESY